ncbi:RNA polymerase sigma-70 factor [Parabacteroides sp. AD58]|uniref:RNA polymerase sigma-70 factor n=1 Tax=Parabacteroides absconsus TaxID=2951805 RepID=A0ABZ2IQY7_9BACT|nr:RNA polymerase sigma-70 factor [Parabacteroides sp. AD58]MCM6902144.1 RNA polymerase sigma-70 factor [Parabacteroides sp. AD58]
MNNYDASPLFQSNLPDETLLSRLKEGDEKAFTAIYIRYNKMLYILAYKYLKDSFRAEDIVQQVFLKLWEARSLFAGAINLRNYLYTSAKNLILNEIRDNFSDMEKNYAVIQNTPEFEDKLQSALEEKDLFQHFYKILAELPEQKRKVCLLKIRDNLSNQEVADKLHISVPTVKSHYSQAIKLLRDKMGRLLGILLLVCKCLSS